MDLMRWSPIKELEEMSDRLSRMFERVSSRLDLGREHLTAVDWTPVVDIAETEREYIIKAELPEVKKDDVKVTLEKGVLTIQGERKEEKEEKGKKFHRVERSYGFFERTFTVPDDVDETKVMAEFKEGLLSVHIPKSEKAKPKAIEVKAAA